MNSNEAGAEYIPNSEFMSLDWSEELWEGVFLNSEDCKSLHPKLFLIAHTQKDMLPNIRNIVSYDHRSYERNLSNCV